MTPASEVDAAAIKAAEIRVLIVDNDAAHARTVAESLERVGFQCAVATSGTQRSQAMPDGGQLVVRTREIPGAVVLDLIDTGCGIEPEVERKCLKRSTPRSQAAAVGPADGQTNCGGARR
jgi:CheY-like chemotaxis protein